MKVAYGKERQVWLASGREEETSGGCFWEGEKGKGLPLHPMAFKLFSIVLALFFCHNSAAEHVNLALLT